MTEEEVRKLVAEIEKMQATLIRLLSHLTKVLEQTRSHQPEKHKPGNN